MIAYVKGILSEVLEDCIVVDIGNIGVNIRISAGFLDALPMIGSKIKVHTYTYVKEDAFLLYGFPNKDDLQLFKLMITVNGIGPKAALAILSVMSGADLRFAICSGDAKSIARANGVGAKTAERLILDLRDKINLEDTIEQLGEAVTDGVRLPETETNQQKKDAIEALVALGYGAKEAAKAVKQVDCTRNPDADSILKAALKFLL